VEDLVDLSPLVLLVLAPELLQLAQIVPATLYGRLAFRLVVHRPLEPRERLDVLKRSHGPVSGNARLAGVTTAPMGRAHDYFPHS
jgi:hypothetical protein